MVSRLELADVLTQLLYHVPAGSRILDVRTIQTFGKIVVEGGSHRPDGLQLVLHQIQVFLLQHLRIQRGFVSIVGEDVPTAKHYITQIGQRNNIFNQMLLTVLCLHGSHLRNRTDGLSQSLAGSQYTGYHRGSHRTTYSYDQNSQMSGSRIYVFFHLYSLFYIKKLLKIRAFN